MAIRIFLSNTINKCIFSNLQFYHIKLKVQNVLKQNYSSRYRPNFLSEQISYNRHSVNHIHQGNTRKLWKSVFFTLTFSGATYIGATIMEYERVRRQNQNNKYYGMWWRRNYNYNTKNSGLLQQIKYWWNNLSHGETIFFSLLSANVLVFLSWKIPKLQPFMFKYFTHQTGSNFSHIPSVLSMFSHCNAYHLIANMYALYTFITPTVHYLGPEHFIALYLTSGVVANLFSTAYKLFTHQTSFSLGASGAIMGVIGYFCNQFSDTKLSIIFLPFITLNADMALKSLILLEITGCLFKWKIFDHAAHLGGALFGMFWYYWGIEYIWKKRTTIMMYWHAIRNPPKSH